ARLGAGRGNAGNALHTDGVDDFASIPNAPSLNLSGAITMAGWVKFDTTQGLRTVVSHGYSASPVAETFLRIADGKYEVGSWNGAAHIASAPIASGDVGQWVHLTGTFDGSSWRLYRNGQLIATKATPVGALANPSVGWGIGAAGNARHFFKGAIDDLHVFDRALSAAEVKTLAV
ncbi:MAG: LamG domain-containing protein, partial [Tepidisphaeraceae bacterium]